MFSPYFVKIGFWSLRSFAVHFPHFHIPDFQNNPHKPFLQRYIHLQITSICLYNLLLSRCRDLNYLKQLNKYPQNLLVLSLHVAVPTSVLQITEGKNVPFKFQIYQNEEPSSKEPQTHFIQSSIFKVTLSMIMIRHPSNQFLHFSTFESLVNL